MGKRVFFLFTFPPSSSSSLSGQRALFSHAPLLHSADCACAGVFVHVQVCLLPKVEAFSVGQNGEGRTQRPLCTDQHDSERQTNGCSSLRSYVCPVVCK